MITDRGARCVGILVLIVRGWSVSMMMMVMVMVVVVVVMVIV